MLHRLEPTLDPILVFPGTRSLETDPTGKHAMPLEVHAACHVSLYDWEMAWKANGHLRYPLKEHAMEVVFFGLLDFTPMVLATTLR